MIMTFGRFADFSRIRACLPLILLPALFIILDHSIGFAGEPPASLSDTTLQIRQQVPNKTFGEIMLDIPEEALKLPIYFVKGLGYVALNGVYRNPVLNKLASYALSFKPGNGLVPIVSYGSNAGFYLGLGYRHFAVFNDDDQMRVRLAYSTHDYQRYLLDYSSPKMFGNSVGVGFHAAYRYRPRDNFFGIGAATSRSNEFAYTIEESTVRPELIIHAHDNVAFKLNGGYSKFNLFDGKDPAVEGRKSEMISRLGIDPAQLRSSQVAFMGGSVELDWRDSKGQPSRGGKESLSSTYYFGDNGDADIKFWRTRFEAAHYLNLYKKRILAARVIVSTVNKRGSSAPIPFYLLSSLGGVDDLRGYSRSRFVDNDMVLATLEYRYPIWALIDAFLFFDYGRVAASITDDLDTHDWHESYGMGLRVWKHDNVLVNLTVGRGLEGTKIFFELGQDW